MSYEITIRRGIYHVDLQVSEDTLAAMSDADIARTVRLAVNAIQHTEASEALDEWELPLGQPAEALEV